MEEKAPSVLLCVRLSGNRPPGLSSELQRKPIGNVISQQIQIPQKQNPAMKEKQRGWHHPTFLWSRVIPTARSQALTPSG